MKIIESAILVLAGAFSLIVAGCSTLPVSGQLPEGLVATKIARIDEGTRFAISPDGAAVAHSKSGLKLLHISTGQKLDLSAETPERLAWSPVGYNLAALYYRDGKSAIVTYDQHGLKVAEASIDGRITDLAWLSESELLAAELRVANYRFGSNYKTLLHRWKPGKSSPVATPLRDTTIQPANAVRWQNTLSRGPMPGLSPTDDFILYLHPLDPPVFSPYYKLILRELPSGREKEIANVSLNSDGGLFSLDGELILFGDGSGNTSLYDPWTEKTIFSCKTPGKNPAFSPDGSHWFADGTLYRGNAPLAILAPNGIARFSPDAKELLLSANGSLYRVTGLRPAKPLPPPSDKLRQLRAWRLEGLISAREYTESKERSNQP